MESKKRIRRSGIRNIDMGNKRKAEDKRRLRKVYVATRNSCIAGVYYDKRKKRYVRFSSGRNGRGRFYRKAGNRKVRRTKVASNHGGYRKIYDYWWKLI